MKLVPLHAVGSLASVRHRATPSAQMASARTLGSFSRSGEMAAPHVASHERNSRHCIRGASTVLSRSCWTRWKRPATLIIGNLSRVGPSRRARGPFHVQRAGESDHDHGPWYRREKVDGAGRTPAVVRPPFRRDVRVGCGRQPALTTSAKKREVLSPTKRSPACLPVWTRRPCLLPDDCHRPCPRWFVRGRTAREGITVSKRLGRDRHYNIISTSAAAMCR